LAKKCVVGPDGEHYP